MTQQPIVLISGFKAGTWLMRNILTQITKMPFFEPEIIPGEMKYYNAAQLQFVPNHYYSWHLVPTSEVVSLLNQHQAKTLFVVRNIYDLILSIYYHFYNNIDEDIGRGANKEAFLKRFSFEEGISLIITGFDEEGIRWTGMVEVLRHYNEIFKASTHCDSLIINYDTLVQNKYETLKEITRYLNINSSDDFLEECRKNSSFSEMKKNAQEKQIGTSHFREGKASSNKKQLQEFHCVQLRQIIKLCVPDLINNAKLVGMQDIITFN